MQKVNFKVSVSIYQDKVIFLINFMETRYTVNYLFIKQIFFRENSPGFLLGVSIKFTTTGQSKYEKW